MFGVRLKNFSFPVAIALMLFATRLSAQSCAPQPGFVDTPHPVVGSPEEFVSHTEEITIDRPLSVVLSAVDKPLKDTFQKTGSLPIVSGDYMLTKGGVRNIRLAPPHLPHRRFHIGGRSAAEREGPRLVAIPLHRVELHDGGSSSDRLRHWRFSLHRHWWRAHAHRMDLLVQAQGTPLPGQSWSSWPLPLPQILP